MATAEHYEASARRLMAELAAMPKPRGWLSQREQRAPMLEKIDQALDRYNLVRELDDLEESLKTA